MKQFTESHRPGVTEKKDKVFPLLFNQYRHQLLFCEQIREKDESLP